MNSSVIGKFAENAVNFLFQHFRGGFDAFSAALGAVIKLLEDGLAAVPFVAMLVIWFARMFVVQTLRDIAIRLQ